ncbi:MAG: hypothetical protein C0594_14055 [Marinilabiliales bacterium]|nr:MAG: hypothetical protein C0594_14055 [Marinilabiliales bacterium]
MSDKSEYGLLVEDLELIISILEKNDRIKEIVLFGSRAKGNYSDGSDIDLALKGDNLELRDLTNVKIDLDGLLIPNKIDLVIFNRITEKALIEHIQRVGIVLYKRV